MDAGAEEPSHEGADRACDGWDSGTEAAPQDAFTRPGERVRLSRAPASSQCQIGAKFGARIVRSADLARSRSVAQGDKESPCACWA